MQSFKQFNIVIALHSFKVVYSVSDFLGDVPHTLHFISLFSH
jgi:hypothetical protein